ncbi:MAG TPA: zf-HC2 domain-containing protein [Candidatus Acidoferrales bacterium]|nr:zf-HC2 domain-containing protein [Candidatus Acidoferrales bacterium]
MNQCWPEGALRAYLDGELSPDEMRTVAAHLNECAACERAHLELSARAGQVAGLMSSLAEVPAPRPLWVRQAGSWRWTAAAVAVAAGLAIATVLVPKPAVRRPAPAAVLGPVAVSQERPPKLPAVMEVQAPVAARTVVRKPSRAVPRPEPFLALDDEPIESGIIMRVTVPGSAPADIVFSPDGRARAIRLVKGTQRDF